MQLNAVSMSLTGAFVLTNLYTNTVLDLSGSNQVTSTSSVSEIIHRFDALTQFPDGPLTEDPINKCAEIVIRPGSDLNYSYYKVDFCGVWPLLHHPKRGLHRQICRLR